MTYPAQSTDRSASSESDSATKATVPQLDDARRILAGADAVLAQGAELLAGMSAQAYARKLIVAHNASIGGHFRHCLDHFSSLLTGLDSSYIDYDHRKRDFRVETDPVFALELTRQIRVGLAALLPDRLGESVTARCEVSYAHGQSPETRSTLGREVVYSIAHAIHHYALIAVMARLIEVPLPAHFGIAPSTVVHLRETAGTQP
jgi:hypothetical protein